MTDIERLDSPIWQTRIEQLAVVMQRPMHVAEVCLVARAQLGWLDATTVNVLAAGERKTFSSKGSEWRVVGAPSPEMKDAEQPSEYQLPKRACPVCTYEFVPRRTKQVYCSNNCRQANFMKRKAA